ncbi:hypothetical protein C8246_00015 [Paracidovorax avenae]|nr:hypothetical protein C8246_00015 [Paracidovorax avenae]
MPVLRALRGVLLDTAAEFAGSRTRCCAAAGPRPLPMRGLRSGAALERSAALRRDLGPSPHALARGLADRVGHINDEPCG